MRAETHECPRCACRWDARNGAYRDEMIQWMQHCASLEDDHKAQVAALTAQIESLRDEAFSLNTKGVILEAEALLLRYDVAEALRRVPAA